MSAPVLPRSDLIRNVHVAFANQGLVPLGFVVNSAADAVTRRQRENVERALVYVSLTRARKLAFVFGYGQLSSWFVNHKIS